MKGLLRKELYTWAKSGSAVIIMVLAVCLYRKFDISASFFVLAAIGFSIGRAFSDDETSKWTDYSHALPYTTGQIVSSKYLFTLTESIIYLAITILIITHNLQSSNGTIFSYSKYIPYLTNDWLIVSYLTLIFTVWMIGIAIAMPLNYKLKGNHLRPFIAPIPLIASMLLCVLYLFFYVFMPLIDDSVVLKILYYERWMFAACGAAVVLAIAASWILCIIFADSSKKRTKKLIAPAAVLAGLLIAITAFSFTTLNAKGYFEESEKTSYENTLPYDYEERKLVLTEQNVTKDQKEVRKKMQELLDSFVLENHLGLTHESLTEEILDMGYYDAGYNYEEFYNVSDEEINDKVTIRLYLEDFADLISVVDIVTDPGQFWIESATDETLNSIANKFTVGMSQKELHEAIKELQVVPTQVSERYWDDNRTLYYTLFYQVGDYNNEGSIYYTINVDVVDGVVSDVRTYTKH